MCKVEPASVEKNLLAAIRAQVGVQAMAAFQTLQEKGVCLAHFCSAVQALSGQGLIHSSDPSHPLVTGLAAAKILELGLEAENNPIRTPAPVKEVRILAQGFKGFLDQVLGRGSFRVV